MKDKVLEFINTETHHEHLEHKTTEQIAEAFGLPTMETYNLCLDLEKSGLITKFSAMSGSPNHCEWVRNIDPK